MSNEASLRFVPKDNKEMSKGMRNTSRAPLTQEEIDFVKSQIKLIEADESVFVFNDEEHIAKSTCYDADKDKIFVTRNIFPDDTYGSSHPMDKMSIRAVLAHEYYGHRFYRDEYLRDLEYESKTTVEWEDEVRASITAAKISPGLTDRDRELLVDDAIKRAEEFNQVIELDDFMKGVLYGYEYTTEKNIVPKVTRIKFVDKASVEREFEKERRNAGMSEV